MLIYYLGLVETEEDQSKLSKIYYEYNKVMMYTALNVLKNEALAQEAVNDAFVRIINNLHKIKMDEIYSHKTKSFLVKIVRNTSIDALNEEKKHIGADFDDINETKILFRNDNSNVDDLMNVQAVYEAIDLLPEIHREILELKIYRDFTDKEIAKFLNISHSVVRKRLQRARENLIQILQKEI